MDINYYLKYRNKYINLSQKGGTKYICVEHKYGNYDSLEDCIGQCMQVPYHKNYIGLYSF